MTPWVFQASELGACFLTCEMDVMGEMLKGCPVQSMCGGGGPK